MIKRNRHQLDRTRFPSFVASFEIDTLHRPCISWWEVELLEGGQSLICYSYMIHTDVTIKHAIPCGAFEFDWWNLDPCKRLNTVGLNSSSRHTEYHMVDKSFQLPHHIREKCGYRMARSEFGSDTGFVDTFHRQDLAWISWMKGGWDMIGWEGLKRYDRTYSVLFSDFLYLFLWAAGSQS